MEGQDSQLTVPFASVSGKQVEAVFDGGVLTSDIGSMLLREVESRIGILSRIVEALPDRRHPSYVVSRIALMRPPMIGIMEPLGSVDFRVSEGAYN